MYKLIEMPIWVFVIMLLQAACAGALIGYWLTW